VQERCTTRENSEKARFRSFEKLLKSYKKYFDAVELKSLLQKIEAARVTVDK